jgi:hypothetical protein
MPLPSSLAGQSGQVLKGVEVIRTAVGITGVINGIHTKNQSFGPSGFGKAEPDCNEHRVASRDVGHGDDTVFHTAGGNGLVGICEGGASPGSEIHIHLVMLCQLEMGGDFGGSFEFTPMTLSVIEGQSDDPITALLS